MVADQECVGMKKDPANVTRRKHKFGFHNRGVQWGTPMSSWAGEGKRLDTTYDTRTAPQEICDKMMRQPTEKKKQKRCGAQKNIERLGALGTRDARGGQRGKVPLQPLRISWETGGVVELPNGDALLTGRHTSSVNTTKKPTCGLG